jgi:hypothetical protein
MAGPFTRLAPGTARSSVAQHEEILRGALEEIPLIARLPQRNFRKAAERFERIPPRRAAVPVHERRIAIAENIDVVSATYLNHDERAFEDTPIPRGTSGENPEPLEEERVIVRGGTEPGGRYRFPEQRSQERFLIRLPRREEEKEFFTAFSSRNFLINERVLTPLSTEADKGGSLHLHHPGGRG